MAIALIVGYVLSGLVVATLLHREGHGPETIAGALLAWPLFLPALTSTPQIAVDPNGSGPLASEIDGAIAGLAQALAATGVDWGGEVEALKRALYAADQRLAVVGQLVDDTPDGVDASVASGLASLRTARSDAEGEIRGLLSEIAQLRLSVGLVALGDHTQALEPRLQSLLSRARSLKGAEDQW